MRTLILSTFLYACESWTLTAEMERRIQALEMRCYRRPEYFECSWNAWWSPDHGKEKETQMVWPHLKILGHERQFCRGQWKEQEGEEDRRRDGKITSRNGVWRFPEGSGRQGRVERYCCNVICGAPTTSEVKGLRWDDDKTKKMTCVPSEDSDQSDQSSLCAQWVAKDPRFLHADREDSDQTGRTADLGLCWAHRSFCWFCQAAALFGILVAIFKVSKLFHFFVVIFLIWVLWPVKIISLILIRVNH